VTQLAYDANDDVWEGTFTLPAGQWQYKVALNGSFDANYGANTTPDGPNITLVLATDMAVKFYYDNKTHWITDNHTSVIATAPGTSTSAAEPHTVNSLNRPPTATVTNGQCSAASLASGVINLALFDADGDPLSLTLVSNSNPTLVPNTNIVLGGAGLNRTLAVSAARSGIGRQLSRSA
jgi:Pullulanase X25 domain